MKRVSLLRLGHPFREKGLCAHSWTMNYYWPVGGITERSLWDRDLSSILGIVKGLDMNGAGGVICGRHDGRGSN
jgi:hypothetical protein